MFTRFYKKMLLGIGIAIPFVILAAPAYGQIFGGHGHRNVYPPQYCPPTPYPHVPVTPHVDPGHPGDLPPGKDKDKDKDKAQPPQAPDQPQTPAFDPGSMASADPLAGAGDVGGTAASSAGLLGRGDSNNRFNLFDNLSAIPRTQIWYGFQYQDDFAPNASSTVLLPTGGSTAGLPAGTVDPNVLALAENRFVVLHRMGAEIALSERISIVAQQQYIVSRGVSDANDSWANPQFAIKAAIIYDPCTVVSAVLGVQPEMDVDAGEYKEIDTRWYPGLLAWRRVNDRLFVQGGLQFGIPTDDAPTTFDWALGAGYWLYRHSSLDPWNNGYGGCGGCGNGGCYSDCGGCGNGCYGSTPFVVGIMPMVEFFGKHIIENDDGIALDLGFDNATAVSPAFAVSTFEGQDVFDMTVGTRVFFRNNLSVGMGVSIPIFSKNEVRNFEFLSTVNLAF